MNFKLKKNPYRFVRYKKYVDGVWYDTDGKGNITTPSTTRGQTYNKETGEITYNLGNGATVVSGNTSDIKGTKTTAGQTTYVNGAKDPNADSGSNTMETIKTVSAAAPVVSSAAPVASTPTYSTSAGPTVSTSSPLGNALKLSYDSQSNLFNPNNKKTSNNGLYKAKAYDKIKTYNPDGTTTMTQLTPKGAAEYNFNNANQFGFGNDSYENNAVAGAKVKSYDAEGVKYGTVNDEGGVTYPKASTPTVTAPETTTEPTAPTVAATNPEPSIIDTIYKDLKDTTVNGYIWDETLISDNDAYNAYKTYLTEKYGADAATQFLNDWATKYMAVYGESPGQVRLSAKTGGTYGTTGDYKNITTVTDAANLLEQKLAGITSAYENNSGKLSAEKSNKQVESSRKDAMTSKRLDKKSYLEAANATGLASGNIDQEEFAREQAYKQRLAALKEIEDENNELLKKYEEAYQKELSDANDEYDEQVEKIRSGIEAQRNAVTNADVKTNANGQSVYSFTDGTGNIKSYSREQLIAAGKQNFVDSMDAEQQALAAYNYNKDIIPYTNTVDTSFGTIRLEGNGKTVAITDLDKMMYDGKVKATFDGKYVTYYGIG